LPRHACADRVAHANPIDIWNRGQCRRIGSGSRDLCRTTGAQRLSRPALANRPGRSRQLNQLECAGVLPGWPSSSSRTSDSRNLRCPPGVRMLLIRPDAAHRVTVLGSTLKSAATSPGVSNRSLLPSIRSQLPGPDVCAQVLQKLANLATNCRNRVKIMFCPPIERNPI